RAAEELVRQVLAATRWGSVHEAVQGVFFPTICAGEWERRGKEGRPPVECARAMTDSARKATWEAVKAFAQTILKGGARAMAKAAERRAHCEWLRDILGPLLFRPVVVTREVLAWEDRLVARLAQGIYDERRWCDMPVLADALLDAGC